MTGGTPARAYYLDTYEQSATADHVTEAGEPEAVFTGVLDATATGLCAARATACHSVS